MLTKKCQRDVLTKRSTKVHIFLNVHTQTHGSNSPFNGFLYFMAVDIQETMKPNKNKVQCLGHFCHLARQSCVTALGTPRRSQRVTLLALPTPSDSPSLRTQAWSTCPCPVGQLPRLPRDRARPSTVHLASGAPNLGHGRGILFLSVYFIRNWKELRAFQALRQEIAQGMSGWSRPGSFPHDWTVSSPLHSYLSLRPHSNCLLYL